MARRRQPEEHENHERWLVSYADFITLLFAFFVVMYSVSSVNEGKYRVLSDSMVAAFTTATKSMQPIQVGDIMRAPVIQGDSPPTSLVDIKLPGKESADIQQPDAEDTDIEDGVTSPEDLGPGGGRPAILLDPQSPEAPMANTQTVADEVEDLLATLISDDFVEVRRKGDWIEIEMKSNFLFNSGSSRMQGEAIAVIKRLSTILRTFPNPIQVEGYTDNVPISTVAFPSNWELSAARAASVVHLLTRYQVRPDRMTAIGYGEHQPIISNATEKGRRKNRRVVIIIPAEKHTRQFLDLKRMMNRGDDSASRAAP